MNMHNVPAILPNLHEIVDEFDEKWKGIPDLIKEYQNFHTHIDSQCCVRGTYVGRVYSYHPSLYENTLRNNLLKSAWTHVYNGLNIKEIASAADRKRFEMALEDPPEFTMDNVRATFGDYVKDPRFHILKGLAECFVDLDQSFKSHSKIKVGVKGLPKRIILSSVASEYSLGWGGERLRDTLNALRVFDGKPHMEHGDIYDIVRDAKKGKVEFEGMALQIYKNGNGHLHFSPDMLRKINLALAEFYGDILPDVEPNKEDLKREPGTAVSKDLQYYPTPEAVINTILRDQGFKDGDRVLEPSCGDGRILDKLAALRLGDEHRCGVSLRTFGVEIHPGRAGEARQKGHKVLEANFLQTIPKAEFDYVIMNPPFYGTHWKKHVAHAMKFLKPKEEGHRWGGGTLICILPASAFYDGHLSDMGLVRKDAHLNDSGWRDSGWRDLPVASFAESGTNVPTGYLVTSGDRWS